MRAGDCRPEKLYRPEKPHRPQKSIVCATLLAVAPLMPMPEKVQVGAAALTIDGSFSATAACPDARVGAAVVRTVERLARQTGIPIGGGTSPILRVECGRAEANSPALGEDESYTLDVSATGAVLKAPTGAGALHGLETFLQLVAPGPNGFQAPAVHIEDRPRFPWRGLMIDASRHWMPMPVIQRNLDAMAAVKMNVLHWHLSDDQGFRVESKRYPRLQERGSDGQFYTQDEIRQVVAYARDRGIRVVPEFDVPGHTSSWFPGYFELMSVEGPTRIERTWGIFDNVMDPTREQTYQFLDSFFGEMAALFPDPYMHIGGDEVNGKQWKVSDHIQRFAAEHHLEGPHGLQVYFNQRLLKILQKYRKTMVGWDEILHPDLPAASVIQSWRGDKSLAEAARGGHRAILSSGYYLDHLSPASYHYGVDPLGGAAADLTPAQASLILGGEACMWAEFVNAETVDSRIWPRAAAIAERFWSPASVKDVGSMYTRMEVVSRLLEYTGVQHRASYSKMLDRIAGGPSAPSLRILADACEATGLGPRARAAKYTQFTPLNRFPDALPAESESVRMLEAAARRRSDDDLKLLRETFTMWAANDTRFRAAAEGNALMLEVAPLSKELSGLGSMGLSILDYLGSGKTTPGDWVAARRSELERFEKPMGEVMVAGSRVVRILVEELGNQK